MNMDLDKALKTQLPPPKEKRDRVKQMAFKGFAGFMILMVALTALSRAAATITTPEVQVGTPKSGRISQELEAKGVLKAKEETDLEVGSGLVVKNIFVKAGQSVKEGEVLLELDAKDLKEKLASTTNDLRKLELRLEQMGLNEDFAEAKTPTEKIQEKITRLKEDRIRLAEQEDTKISKQEAKVTQAEEELIGAEADLEDVKTNNLEKQIKKVEEDIQAAKKNVEEQKYEKDKAVQRAEKTFNDAKEQLWITQGDATIALQNYERAKMEYEFTKTDWERKVKEAETSLKQAEEKLEKLQNGEMDEELIKQEEAKIKSYEKQVQQEKNLLQEAIVAKEQAILNMDRQIQDAEKELVQAGQEEANNLLKEEQEDKKEAIDKELMVLDIKEKQREIAQLKNIVAQGGKLVAPKDGTISEVKVQKGQTTSVGELVTFVDENSEYILEVEVSSEESKYLEVGQEVEVSLEGEKRPVEGAVIESILTTPGSGGDKKKVSITVAEGEIGISATMQVKKESEKYDYVLPIGAVKEDNGSYYVLVVKEKETTLGKQMVVERIKVEILDKNQDNVAVEGAISMQDQVIVGSNKPILAGDTVRLLKQ